MIRHYNSSFSFHTVPFIPAGESTDNDPLFSSRSMRRNRAIFHALNIFEPSCATHEHCKLPSKPSKTAPATVLQSNAPDARRSLEETGSASSSESRRAVSDWLRREGEAGHFSMNFQPLYEKQSAPGRLAPGARKVSHFEALIRHPHYKPAEFIPAVEKWAPVEFALLALRITAQAAVRHPNAAFSVNMPGAAFDDKRLPMLIKKVLDETRVDSRRIMIEVTETGLLPDMQRMRAALHALREAGHEIAIDDYDMGHTRHYISALLNGPLTPSLCNLVKTDRECVQLMNLSKYPDLQSRLKIIDDPLAPLTLKQRRAIEEVEHDAFVAFVALVHDMHRMGVRVAAEGVEYPVEAALLDSIDVDMQQGFVHSKPRPAPSIA